MFLLLPYKAYLCSCQIQIDPKEILEAIRDTFFHFLNPCKVAVALSLEYGVQLECFYI